MKRCAQCRFKARYDKDPQAVLGRIWKWHTGWCPGWRSYLKSLPDEARRKLMEHYR